MVEVTADKLVNAYIKIRDERAVLKKAYDVKDSELEAKQKDLEVALLDILSMAGGENIRTVYGTATRSLKTKYWTTDWKSMYKVIQENNAPHLLEQRIHQTNMRKFLEEHPDIMPMGLNVAQAYSITVRRATNKDE